MNFDFNSTAAGAATVTGLDSFEDTLALDPVGQIDLEATLKENPFANVDADAVLSRSQHANPGQCVVRIPSWCVSYLPMLVDEQFYEAPTETGISMLEYDDFNAPNGVSKTVEILKRLRLPFDAEGHYRGGRCETLVSARIAHGQYEFSLADTPPLDELLNVIHCDRLILLGSMEILGDYVAEVLGTSVRNQASVLKLRHSMPLTALDEYEWLMQYEDAFGKEPDRFDS
jgi:hypothetical protein